MIRLDDPAAAQAMIDRGVKPGTLATSRLANTIRDTPPMSLEFWAGFRDCNCDPCLRLKAECGSHYAWLSRKLLARGWAGKTSPAEKAYQKAHVEWATAPPPTEAQLASRAKYASRYRRMADAS